MKQSIFSTKFQAMILINLLSRVITDSPPDVTEIERPQLVSNSPFDYSLPDLPISTLKSGASAQLPTKSGVSVPIPPNSGAFQYTSTSSSGALPQAVPSASSPSATADLSPLSTSIPITSTVTPSVIPTVCGPPNTPRLTPAAVPSTHPQLPNMRRSSRPHVEHNYSTANKVGFHATNTNRDQAILVELTQMLSMKVFKPAELHHLTSDQWKHIIPSTILVKDKFDANGLFLSTSCFW